MANSRDLSFLDKLPLSINTSSEEKVKRQDAIKAAEQTLNQTGLELSEEELATINKKLAIKNYHLSLNAEKKWILLDRDSAFSLTYDERFADFVNFSDDKEKEIEALDHFITKLSESDYYTQLILTSKNTINLLDIGAGDGVLGLDVTRFLNKNYKNKVHYIGIEANEKVFPGLLKNCAAEENINCTVNRVDFRKIKDELSRKPALIALVSHVYTGTKMHEFIPLVLKTLSPDGMCVAVHESAKSDAVIFRATPEFSNILKINRDWTSEVDVYFDNHKPESKEAQYELHTITTTYESTLTFPEFSKENWLDLKKIKQADYLNAYSVGFSAGFKTLKNLIESVLSDRLEAFDAEDRNKLVDAFQGFLKERNNKIKSICKVQTALSPNHTDKCKEAFLELKEKLEKKNSYDGKLFDNKAKKQEEKKPMLQIGLRR